MTVTEFLQAIKQPEHRFADTLAFIDANYQYTACAFENAGLHNAAGSNQGSCKIFGLALLENLSTHDALLAFGEHYRRRSGNAGRQRPCQYSSTAQARIRVRAL